MYTKKIKNKIKVEDKCTPKIFIVKHIKNSSKMHPKNTKKTKNTQKLQKSHQKCQKLGITEILPGGYPR
jgi:hypothetical protein